MSDAAPLQGDQRPRILWTPPGATSSAGQEAVDLAAGAGLVLDPWQAFVLDHALAERADGKWAAFEVGLVVPRQNGKGSILEARELAGLFLFGERLIIHSAHLFDTSLEAFRRLMECIESTPWMDARVSRVSRSHGEEGIELKNRQRIRFKTRTLGGGRGLTGDVVILDEAMILGRKSHAALMPTMAAKSIHGNPQLWYTGSAGDEASEVFGVVRSRAIDGGDPGLCYMEWSVDDAAYRKSPRTVSLDPRSWAQANPGMGIRISEEHIAREQRAMGAEEYARERLSVGTWPSPDGGWSVISKATWSALADMESEPADPVAFGFDINPERSFGAIAIVGANQLGREHAEVIAHEPGIDWIVEVLARASLLNNYNAVVTDASGPGAALVPALERRGVKVTLLGAQDVARACGGFYDSVTEGRLTHRADPNLSAALAVATKAPSADAWKFSRKDVSTDISPLYAATFALHGHAIAPPLRTFWGARA